MKCQSVIVLIIVFFVAGCANKDINYYKRKYMRCKNDYVDTKNMLDKLLNKKDSLFKIVIEFTGRRLIEYQYKNDTSIYFFENTSLSPYDKKEFEDIMYKQGLQYVIGYRDSTKYIFSGMHKDIIIECKSGTKPDYGNLIDTNTYLFFEKSR